MELTDLEEKYKSLSLGENGVMLYRQTSEKEEDHFELIRLDSSLQVVWKEFFLVGKGIQLLRVQHYKEQVYFLFKERNVIGTDFQIASVRLSDAAFGSYTVKNIIPFMPSSFIVTDEAALVGGYFNYRPLVVYYSFKEKRAKILAGFFNEPGELNQLKAFEDGSVDVIVSARNFEKKRCLWIRNYDSQGNLVKTTIIQPEKDKNLIFGNSIKLANGEEIIAGAYGRYSNAEYSRGLFVAGINKLGEYSIDYYNFGHLQNFFSYMRAGRQKRLKSRIERKTIRGKKVKFNYRFIIHDFIPYKNQYIMTGEAFYPHYIYTNMYSNTYRSSFSRSYTSGYFPQQRNDMIFDGYQYTHAVVIGFDSNGKLAWDNSFEINDVRTMELEKFVKVRPQPDRIIMMYLYSNTLRTKIIHDAEVLEGKTKDPLKLNPGSEVNKIKQAETEQLDYWYGDYFYTFGIQKWQFDKEPTKRILYINKITYH